MYEFQLKFQLKFVLMSLIDNMWALFQTMPLSEPMLTQFTDAYAALGGNELIPVLISHHIRYTVRDE